MADTLALATHQSWSDLDLAIGRLTPTQATERRTARARSPGDLRVGLKPFRLAARH
jgi:hypothetical protein